MYYVYVNTHTFERLCVNELMHVIEIMEMENIKGIKKF